jgi:hypothetical protein
MYSVPSSYFYTTALNERKLVFTATNKYAFSPKIYQNLFCVKNDFDYIQSLANGGQIIIYNSKLRENINYFINMKVYSNKIKAKQIFLDNILKKDNKINNCYIIGTVSSVLLVVISMSKLFANIVDNEVFNIANITIIILNSIIVLASVYISKFLLIYKVLLYYFDLHDRCIPILIKIENDYINIFERNSENDINLEIKHELFYIFNKYLHNFPKDLTNIIIGYTVNYKDDIKHIF